MDKLTLAYLAGAMDSDGWFGIKKSTYHMRVRGDATQPVYSERLGIGQVTPHIPGLLREQFGGYRRLQAPGTPNSKPMHKWDATNKIAAQVAASLLPFLRVKAPQARVLLELRASKQGGYWQEAYWFALDYPNWREGELITATEAMTMLRYSSRQLISQALHNGTLLALPYDHCGVEQPRIPLLLVQRVLENKNRTATGRKGRCPRQLMEWRERLYQQARELNKLGLHGTPIYHQTGYHAPTPI
jgi:hypothetical protein